MIKTNLNMISLIELKPGAYFKAGLYLSLGWGIGQIWVEVMQSLTELLFMFLGLAVG
ncbi:hypothetical protein VPHZ6_orf00048 [Vibrio phage VPHZ6]|nr:hypothetical protein VPHZ6_orf00048 [Vibrio phage VPHZ6]